MTSRAACSSGTVPAPMTHSGAPSPEASCWIAWSAPGVVSVISIEFTPPADSAAATAEAPPPWCRRASGGAARWRSEEVMAKGRERGRDTDAHLHELVRRDPAPFVLKPRVARALADTRRKPLGRCGGQIGPGYDLVEQHVPQKRAE